MTAIESEFRLFRYKCLDCGHLQSSPEPCDWCQEGKVIDSLYYTGPAPGSNPLREQANSLIAGKRGQLEI